MIFNLSQLFLICLLYLLILFGSAYAAERGWISQTLVKHPVTYILSLGVFTGSMAFFGAVDLAYHYGSNYLLYFVGASAAFLLAPLFLSPIQRVTDAYNLGSIADIFAFRYPGKWTGAIVVSLMLITVMPLLAMQIQAVAISLSLVNKNTDSAIFGFSYCLMIVVFAIIFGTRHISNRDKHEGLVIAIALESLTKILAMLVIACYAVYGVFGDFSQMQNWLVDNSDQFDRVQSTLSQGPARSLLLIFFAGTIVLPHIHHMGFIENREPEVLMKARWGFPLMLLIMSLTVPPVLWAGLKLGLGTNPEYFMLSLVLDSKSQLLTMIALIGGLTASSGVLIVITLAMASMTLNHIILPVYQPGESTSFYSWLLNARRVLICTIVLLAYFLFLQMDSQLNLAGLGIVAFVAALQFLPGLVGALVWRDSSKAGFVVGLSAGFTIWFITLMLPLIYDVYGGIQLTRVPLLGDLPEMHWHISVVVSFTLNLGLFVIVSYFTRQSFEENRAANSILSRSIRQPHKRRLHAESITVIRENLTPILGETFTNSEVNQAIVDLGLEPDEKRPHALLRLRDHLESNLSSLMGQTISRRIINEYLPYAPENSSPLLENVQALESRLELTGEPLTGLAAEIDNLRRYHRQILQELPIAVCSIDHDGVVLSWNRAMEELTGVRDRVIGLTMSSIPDPWQDIILEFSRSTDPRLLKKSVKQGPVTKLLNLHKSASDEDSTQQRNLVIVIEDITELQRLEDRLTHKERLASLGQLAAGVAHEIGNPITAIACLAQNLKLDPSDEEVQESSVQIVEQTERISAILQLLSNFAHNDRRFLEHQNDLIDVRECLDESINLVSLNSQYADMKFRNQCSDCSYTLGDKRRLSQVFLNLLTNACDASSPLGNILIQSRTDDNFLYIDIIDEGHGISSANLKQVLEPFFTTKDPGSGTGLGLAIAHSIIQEHKGDLLIQSPALSGKEGTCVTVKLPLAPEFQTRTGSKDTTSQTQHDYSSL
jgi:PAS domain S-box-containing protein